MRILDSLKNIWYEFSEYTLYATHDRTPFFDIAKKHLTTCDKILDIGAGDGGFIKYFGRNDIYAMDGNSNAVNNLRNLKINAICAVLPDMPFPDNFFEGVHASHILEHLYPEDFYRALKEMDRVLKPNGILVISSPMMWEKFYSDLSHIKPYDPEIFKNYLCENSAKSLTRPKIGGYRIKNLTYRYAHEELKPFILRGCNVFNFLSLLFIKLLKNIGVRYLYKSGYTIVLEKYKREIS